MDISPSHVRRYWFGVDDTSALGDIVLLMERDRLEQYKAAFDLTEDHFKGVFSGITGQYRGRRISAVYSIGPAHVADCVNFLVHGFNVKRFVATGSVGGLHAEMGDLIVSQSCSTQDGYALAVLSDRIQRDKELGQYVDIDGPAPPDVSQTVRDRTRELFDCDIRSGRMFTVPSVSVEDKEHVAVIKNRDYVALDLETGPFLAACAHNQVQGTCIHWVTDLPLTRNFYYPYDGDPYTIEADRVKKHRQWLNMPRLILPVLESIMDGA